MLFGNSNIILLSNLIYTFKTDFKNNKTLKILNWITQVFDTHLLRSYG